MKRRLVLTVFVIASLAPISKLAATPPTSYWSPTTIGSHSQACDNAVTHRQSLRLAPGTGVFNLKFFAPASVTVTEAHLHYSINGGAPVVQTRSFTSVFSTQRSVDRVVSFELPEALFREGDILDYAAEIPIVLASSGSPCAGQQKAISPNKFGRHTVYTNQADPTKSPYRESILHAWSIIQSQPDAEAVPATDLCEQNFNGVNPCNVYPITSHDQGCNTSNAAEPFVVRLDLPGGTTPLIDSSNSKFAEGCTGHKVLFGVVGHAAQNISIAEKRVKIDNLAIAPGASWASIDGYVYVGFQFTVGASSTKCGFTARPRLDWRGNGEQRAASSVGANRFSEGSASARAELFVEEIGGEDQRLSDSVAGTQGATVAVNTGPRVEISPIHFYDVDAEDRGTLTTFKKQRSYIVYAGIQIVAYANANFSGGAIAENSFGFLGSNFGFVADQLVLEDYNPVTSGCG